MDERKFFKYEWSHAIETVFPIKSEILKNLLELLKDQWIFSIIKEKIKTKNKISIVFDIQNWDDTGYCAINNNFTAQELGDAVVDVKGDDFCPQQWNRLLVLMFEKDSFDWINAYPRQVQILSSNSAFCCAKTLSLRDFYERVQKKWKSYNN